MRPSAWVLSMGDMGGAHTLDVTQITPPPSVSREPARPPRSRPYPQRVNQKAPAGWYDDPAGSGGQRFWNGQAWTERVEPTGSTTRATPRPSRGSRERLPDGYMLLNGERVPLGQLTPPPSTPPRQFGPVGAKNRGVVVAAAVAIGVVVLFLVSSLVPTEDPGIDLGDWSGGDGDFAARYTLEVDSRDGTGVDVIWSDGTDEYTETAVDPGWSTDIGAVDGGVRLDATANDGRDIPTCRILDADGSVIIKATAAYPGGTATCRWND
ncbi:DUF2510 domain-containing protein [Aeromicrobium sp. zg-629]|nr:DUF2510 domain-containing protein [Aeromicrobium senzhongii]